MASLRWAVAVRLGLMRSGPAIRCTWRAGAVWHGLLSLVLGRSSVRVWHAVRWSWRSLLLLLLRIGLLVRIVRMAHLTASVLWHVRHNLHTTWNYALRSTMATSII